MIWLKLQRTTYSWWCFSFHRSTKRKVKIGVSYMVSHKVRKAQDLTLNTLTPNLKQTSSHFSKCPNFTGAKLGPHKDRSPRNTCTHAATAKSVLTQTKHTGDEASVDLRHSHSYAIGTKWKTNTDKADTHRDPHHISFVKSEREQTYF